MKLVLQTSRFQSDVFVEIIERIIGAVFVTRKDDMKNVEARIQE